MPTETRSDLRIPYGQHWVEEDDVAAVCEALRSDYLTTGPRVEALEAAFARATGARHAVAVSSGTAALHATMAALGIGPGDEVVVPAMTFAATANCVVYCGATPVFTDVEPDTLLLGPAQLQAKLTRKTRAVIAVDYAGQPCDYDALRNLSERHGFTLVADACHALGASYRGRPVGSLTKVSTFSLHPVKVITSAEGGMVTTDEEGLARRMRRFRNHGIDRQSRDREMEGSWFYQIEGLGYNYRLSDLQCALAASQLKKLRRWVERRQEIARRYDDAFARLAPVRPLAVRPGVSHAYHLYVVQLDLAALGGGRREAFSRLRAEGIGVNVHYIPVHLHPFYRARFGTGAGLCPVAEAAYQRILSLPIYPRLRDEDCEAVISAVRRLCEG